MRYCYECVYWKKDGEFCSLKNIGADAYDNCGKWSDGKLQKTSIPSKEELIAKTKGRRAPKGKKKKNKLKAGTGQIILNKALMNEKESGKTEIQKMREKTGMSQASFVHYFGIPYSTLQDWESGKTLVPQYVLNMIGKIIKYEGLSKEEEMEESSKNDSINR